jgi:hypothetical protein
MGPVLHASSHCKGTEELKRLDCDKTKLQGVLRVAIGDRVKFVDNLAPAPGLVYNARGREVGFGRGSDSSDIQIIFVKMTDASRLSPTAFLEGAFGRDIIPVPRVTTEFAYRTKTIRRSQFPLAIAYASTIHSV